MSLNNWKLKTNHNFDAYLQFTQLLWCQRKLAGYANIDLSLTKVDDTTFYKCTEDIVLDGKERTYGGAQKAYSVFNNVITANITGDDVHGGYRTNCGS